MNRVLVVDDSAFMRASIKQILSRHNYRVVGEAEDGKMAVDKYKELLPDIVTLDITMKEMSGLEALKIIMEYNPRANVVMVSAMGQRPIVQEALALGAKGFLLKPFEEENVASTLQKLCQG